MIFLLAFFTALAWVLWRALFARLWSRQLQVLAVFEDSSVFEGETSFLRETIVNDKLLPVPALEVRLAVDRSLVFSGEAAVNTKITDQSYKRDIFSIFSRQQIVRRLSFTCQHRGFYEIRSAGLVASDPFSGASYLADQPQSTSLFVYPARVDTRKIEPVCRAVSGMVLSRSRLFPDPFEFSGIRDYVRSDPRKTINWKASARSQKLMVNQHDSTTLSRILILLDTEDRSILLEEPQVEESIRIAASLASRFAAAKMDTELLSTGMDPQTGKPLFLSLPGGAARIPTLNQKLACLRTGRDSAEFSKLLFQESSLFAPDKTCILISKNEPDVRALFPFFQEQAPGLIWIYPHLPGAELPKNIPFVFYPWKV